MNELKMKRLALGVSLVCASAASAAQEAPKAGLEEVIVTAQKRAQSLQDVPISISTMSGEKFDSLFSGGADILALAARAPGLYAESSNGRVAPRFYLRGLGNTDFDLAASQPVSVIMDDVVKENVILKSFPLFDVQQVEVLRGPQGTLFGRNTTAGIVKFDSVKPSQEFDGYAKATLGSLGTKNFEAAVGGGLSETISARVSVLTQNRDDWISNAFTDEDDVMGGFNENAIRAQLLIEPTDMFSALVSVHSRDLDGTSTIFRANGLKQGSNDLSDYYDRDTVWYDAGDNNPQEYSNTGGSLKMDVDFGDVTLTSITAYETLDGRSLGDIDGGVYIDEDGNGEPEFTYPGFIPFSALTEDKMDDFHQLTQEFRLASADDEKVTWQTGLFFFDSGFDVTSIDGFFGATTVTHENSSWSAFGQMTFAVNDRLDLTGGLRYTYDEKTLVVGEQNVDGFALVIGAAQVQDYDDVEIDDGKVSYEVSANYIVNDAVSTYARLAYGFRAPTIQARDVAFESAPSVADSETVTSLEVGFKMDILEDTLRLNGAVYNYQIDDMQFSAIGGDGNFTRLVNAEKGLGRGLELDAEWFASEFFSMTAGFSYNKTEIDDSQLRVSPCGSGACTVTDPLVSVGEDDVVAVVDGNPFPQAPEITFNMTARLALPMGEHGEFYAYTDWAYQGDTNIFLYEAKEYAIDGNIEGGLRVGYNNFMHNYSVSVFGRNITDEENVRGAIDFNNLTVIDNEPRIVGIEFQKDF